MHTGMAAAACIGKLESISWVKRTVSNLCWNSSRCAESTSCSSRVSSCDAETRTQPASCAPTLDVPLTPELLTLVGA